MRNILFSMRFLYLFTGVKALKGFKKTKAILFLIFIFSLQSNVFSQTSTYIPATGSNSVTTAYGYLYTGCYDNSQDGYTIIYPSNSASKVQLTGTYDTESSWDYIYIYNGAGTGGTLLFSGSGYSSIPTTVSTAADGSLTVRFYSDFSNSCYDGYGVSGVSLNISNVPCMNFNSNYPSGTASTTSSSWQVISSIQWGGEYSYYQVEQGAVYEWTTCQADGNCTLGGSCLWDSKIALWNQTGTTLYTSNDNYCGTQAKINWTAPSDQVVRFFITGPNCETNTISTTTLWRCVSCPSPIGGSSSPVSGEFCQNNSTTVDLTGQYGNIVRWERQDPGSGTWVDIGNPGATSINTGVLTLVGTYKFRAVLVKCGITVYSTESSIIIHSSVVPNDDCLNATAIGSLPYTSGVLSNWCATSDNNTASSGCGSHYNNVWFWVTGTGNLMEANLCDGSTTFDSEIHIFTGNCGALTEVACNDDYCSTQSKVTWCSNVGEVYRISVGSYYSTGYGNYNLQVLDYPLGTPTAISATNTDICVGASTTLSATPGTNGDDIAWYSGSCGGTFVGNGLTISVSPSTTTTYYAKTRNSTCSSVSSACLSITINSNSIPDAPDILPNIPSGTEVCEGQMINATFTAGSGGTGTVANIFEYSSDGGTNWFTYTPGSNLSTTGISLLYIRSTRTASGTGCTTDANTATWSVVPDPVSQTVNPNLPAGTVCEGQDLSATFSGGSGGAGTVTDVYQYSIDGGNNWLPYTAGSTISTTGHVGSSMIQIRTQRFATGPDCNPSSYNSVIWSVTASPIAQNIDPVIPAGDICLGASVSATFSGGSGGTGTITDVYEFSTDAGTNWNPYTPGNAIVAGATGTDIIQIRTYRTATGSGCTNSSYNTIMWSVFEDPSPQLINPNIPTGSEVCDGQSISATFSGGSGGSGTITDVYEYSTDGGLSWQPYSSGANISSTGLSGSDIIRIRTNRTATGAGCDASSYNSATWTVVPLPVAQTINPNLIDGSVVCQGQVINATFSGGSGGTGTITDNNEFSVDGGNTWSAYTSGTDISTVGLIGIEIVQIRTSRNASGSGCGTSPYHINKWSVVSDPVAQDIVPNIVSGQTVCQGQVINATFTGGTGGTGTITDVYEFSTDGGVSWSSYNSGSDISTNLLTGTDIVQIRTQRTATGSGCDASGYNTTQWSVVTGPVAQTISPNIPDASEICQGQVVNATFTGGSGGSGIITDVYEYSVDGGVSWLSYTPGTDISTGSLLGSGIVQIRTNRTATGSGCSASGYNTMTWTVVPGLVPQTINPNITSGETVCQGQLINATFTGGSGGTGTVTDIYEYSIDGGSTWSTYSPSNDISTNGLVGNGIVSIRTYRTATGTGCTSSGYTTSIWNVVENPVAQSIVPNIPGSSTICQGQVINATFTGGSGGTGTVTDTYEYSTDGGTNWSTYGSGSDIASLALSGNDVIRIRTMRNADGPGCSASQYNTDVWTVITNTSIVLQPLGDTICTGGTHTMSTSATGGIGTYNYQWQYSLNGSTWNDITGANNSSYTTDPLSQLTYFHCQVGQNGYGCVNAVTDDVTVVINNITVAGTATAADTVMCIGGSTNVDLAGYVGNISGWESQLNGGGWVNIGQAGTATINTGTMNTSGIWEFRAAIQNGICPTAYSAIGRVRIDALSVGGYVVPGATNVCLGDSTPVSLNSNVGMVDHWILQQNGGSFFDIGHPNSNSINSGPMNISGVWKYRVIVINGSCPADTSYEASIHVNLSPAITLNPLNDTLCDGESTTYSVAASNSNQFKWQVSTNAGASWNDITAAGTSPVYANWNTALLSVNNVIVGNDGYLYRCVVSGTCLPSDTSTNAILKVRALPTITSHPVNALICVAHDTTFTVNVTGSGIIYQWQVNTGTTWANITAAGSNPVYVGWNSNVLHVHNVIISNNGYKYRCVVQKDNCLKTSDNATLTVSTCAGVEEFDNNRIVVYPNPFYDDIEIRFDRSMDAVIKLYSLDGKLLLTQMIKDKSEETLKTAGLPMGVYMLRVETDGGMKVFKIVKN